ncbi:hypothetical protein IFM89_028976 [Coptis chinensis]|uniref:Uncharacterized protein n=1 Tax=Coptis chinensis TaxID=261450 RepID=A0A835IDX2_9MAGN|nr:hypothetical protein IFM89_028976 [Coptis chinensis]
MEKWLNCFKTKQHFLSWDIVHWKVISRHHTKVGLEDGPSNECEYISRDLREESHEQLSCGCHKLDGFLEEHRRLAVKSGDWIQLSYQILSCTCKVGHPGHFAALFLASFFTLIYSILQLFHRLLCYGSQASLCAVLEKVFTHTWENIYIRSCRLLYGPICLQDSGFRSQSNVEYAHRAALHRHTMWSSVAVDILLGNAVGFTLLLHIDTACSWVLALPHDITNNWLRSGCVWLMGVPAGFKLNTELAGILGVISLNAIWICLTLWICVAFLFHYRTCLIWYYLRANNTCCSNYRYDYARNFSCINNSSFDLTCILTSDEVFSHHLLFIPLVNNPSLSLCKPQPLL